MEESGGSRAGGGPLAREGLECLELSGKDTLSLCPKFLFFSRWRCRVSSCNNNAPLVDKSTNQLSVAQAKAEYVTDS